MSLAGILAISGEDMRSHSECLLKKVEKSAEDLRPSASLMVREWFIRRLIYCCEERLNGLLSNPYIGREADIRGSCNGAAATLGETVIEGNSTENESSALVGTVRFISKSVSGKV